MKKKIAFLLVWLLLSQSRLTQQISSIPSSSSFSLEYRVEAVRKIYEAGHLAEASDSCNALLPLLDANQGAAVLRADLLSLWGSILRDDGKSDRALPLHGEALSLREFVFTQKSEPYANTCQNIGNCLLDLGQLSQAGPFFEKAFKIKSQIFSDRPQKLISVYSALGNYYRESGNFKQAQALLSQSLSWAEQIYGSRSRLLLIRLQLLANYWHDAGRPDSALFFLRQAWGVQRDSVGIDRPESARLLRIIADNLSDEGNTQESLQQLDSALAICGRLVPRAPQVEAECLLSAGNCLLDISDFETARLRLEAALLRFHLPAQKATVLNSLALVHRYQGTPDKALAILEEAMNQLDANSQQYLPDRLRQSLLISMGSCYADLNKLDSSFIFYKKALDIRLPGSIGANTMARLLNKMGENALARGNMREARTFVQQAVALSKKIGNKRLLYTSIFYQGEIEAAEKNYFGALYQYQQALEALGIGDDPEQTLFPYEAVQSANSISLALKKIARQSGRTSDWKKTLAAAEKGIAFLDALGGRIRNERSEMDLRNIFFQLYGTAVAACYALDEHEHAFVFSERCKSGLLQKLSRAVRVRTAQGLERKMLQEESRIEKELSFFQKKRFDTQSAAEVTAADSLIQRLLTRRSQLRQTFREQDARVHGASLSDVLLPPDSVRAKIPAQMTLLEYQWCDDELILFVLRQDTFVIRSLSANESLAEDVLRFFYRCSRAPSIMPDAEKDESYADLVALASSLHEHLVKPVQGLLTEQLLIVPDAVLCYLPFGALLSQPIQSEPSYFAHHEWLVKNHVIQYGYSAGLHLFLLNKPLGKATKPLLSIAPHFNDPESQFKPLHYNMDEASLIAEQIEAGERRLGKEASKEQFMQESPDFQVIHLATHGFANDRDPDMSFVAFAKSAGNKDAFETLHASEISYLPLNADLVVLSACQTAGGRLFRGEGIISIARAFQIAGARSVVSSLWNVDDALAVDFMKDFYKEISFGKNVPAALANAQKTMREDKHPYYWAGFISTGASGSLEKLRYQEPSIDKYWLFAFACLFAMVLFWGRWKRCLSHRGRR